MARLDFDFHPHPARPGKLAAVLLLAGVAASTWVWSNLQAAHARHDDLSAQIATLETAKQRTAAKPVARAGTTAYSRIAAQLAFSWQPAFEALAATHSNKIALVSLDAIQAKSQLKLTAEARQLADAIAFIEALQQQPGVKRATLIQHQVQAEADQKPVRFDIMVELGA
jgi:nitrate reductase NapAB chaperone NapD